MRIGAPPPRWLLIGLLFFVSGFTGLLYEVLWAKYLALLLGSTAYAQVGVLAVFMGGLAVGSVVWGGAADRHARPLALYGALEIGIGLCAAAFALGFDGLSQAYWWTLAWAGNIAPAVKVALCIVAMFPATVCMGGTLPVLSRALGVERNALGRGVAYLYAVNSLGAALGAIITGFYLVAQWGFDAPFLVAALVNVVVGLLALGVARGADVASAGQGTMAATAGEPARLERREPDDFRGYFTLVLAAAAISGGVAMIDEIAWIRLCSLVLGSSTYSFSIMLAAFIVGIAAGSGFYVWTAPARGRPLRFFAFTSLLAAAVLLACLPVYDRLPYCVGRLIAVLREHHLPFGAYQAVSLLFCINVMLPVTFMSGLNFPALAQAASQARTGVGGPVSRILFANTAGTIAGAVGGGLYLLPLVGLRRTFLVGTALLVLTALAILTCDRGVGRARRRAALAAVVVVCLAYAVLVPAWDLRLLSAGEFRRHEGITDASFSDYRSGLEQQILFYRDGASATVSVERQPMDEMVLRVNGKADASIKGDRNTELLCAHLPAVIHPGARRALVIGYGSGVTVGAVLQHGFTEVDVVEISPEVIAADRQFRPYNHDPLYDRRTHLHIEDARTFLYRAPQVYDLIISEPSNPWIAGIGNLFTQEFFVQARSRLAADGVLVQWFHTYESSDALVTLILRTVMQTFADVRVFQSEQWDVLMIASPTRRVPDREAMEAAFGHATELREVGIDRLTTMLTLEVLPDALARRLAGSGAVNRDRMPRLEYAAPRAFFDGFNARLFERVDPVQTAGYLQTAVGWRIDDYRAAAVYLQRTGMEGNIAMLRLLAGWLARAPADTTARELLTGWISSHTNAPQLLRALTDVAASVEPAAQPDYAVLLLLIVGSLHSSPMLSEVEVIAPVVRAAAQQAPERPDVLFRLGESYAAAGDPGKALASFDAALATFSAVRGDGGRMLAPLRCARGLALERTGPLAAARAAYEQCLQADGSNRVAMDGLRRLAEAPDGPH